MIRVWREQSYLRAVASIDVGAVDLAVEAFTNPERVRRWWGGELDIDLLGDGIYRVDFPGLERTLRGRIHTRNSHDFGFGWNWDGETDSRFTVRISSRVEQEHGLLLVEHGPYRDEPGDQAEAEAHRQGWEFHLPRLQTELGGGEW